VLRWLLALLAVAVPAVGASAGRGSVLVVLPDPPGRPAATVVLDGIQSTLRAADPSIAISADYLPLRADRDSGFIDAELSWFRAKYAGVHFDVIIVLEPQTLRALMPLRDALWPGTPVVFCGVGSLSFQAIQQEPEVTGALVSGEVDQDLDVIRHILPGTRNIALICGASAADRYYGNLVTSELHESAPQLHVIALTGLGLAELKSRVALLPPQTVVLVYIYLYDPAGHPMYVSDLVAALSPVSNSPLMELTDFSMGSGAVGGHLVQLSKVGGGAARTALRILAGEKASSIPVRRINAASYIFDWRQLQRWKIPLSSLPPGSEIRYRPFSLWEHYWWVIVLAAVGAALESILVAVLLWQRRRARETEAARTRAELETAAARDEISHLNRVASMGELAASLAHELNQPLAGILSNAQAAQRFLAQPEPDLGEVREALDDIRDDDARAGEIIGRIRGMLKKEPTATEAVDLNAAVRETLSMLSSDAMLRKVTLDFVPSASCGGVLADPVQLRQVIMNLVLNAMEAINGPGRVVIRTLPGARENDILVADSGPGIPPEVAERVFKPFFTTKKEGLGMGLSIVSSILASHGGRISLARGAIEGLHGATFRVTLPSAPMEAASAASAL
jgi:signal transduction histidine kinase